jgi:hypothetical protein
MSDVQFIDVDSEDFEDAPRALRDAYKKLKKEFQTATAERDDYKGKWQSKSANDALSSYGFKNPKRVSKDLIADGVDLSDTDAVKAWVGENGDDYAKGEAAPAQAEQTVDHSAEEAERAKIAATSSQAQPAGVDKMQAALAEITSDMTTDQVMEVYRKHGI